MPFYTEMSPFYQDRLGTNVGKALKKRRVSAGLANFRVVIKTFNAR
jgi:hypothetical protein